MKKKGEVLPDGPSPRGGGGGRGIAPLILNLITSGFICGVGQRYQLTRFVGSQRGSGRVGGDTKLVLTPGFEPWPAQSAACNRPCQCTSPPGRTVSKAARICGCGL